jgi:hypothetical protein
MTAPSYVYHFINNILKMKSIESALDPWFTFSSPLLHIKAIKKTCICPMEYDKVVSEVFPEQNIIPLDGFPFDMKEKLSDKFDLIVCFPPLGMKRPIEKGNQRMEHILPHLISDCNELLKDDGIMLMLGTNAFLYEENGKKIIDKVGLYVDAFFSIPSRAFSPITNLPTNLILLKRGQKAESFAAEISSDESLNSIILENYLANKEAKTLKLGAKISFGSTKSFEGFIAEKELINEGRRTGFSPILLGDLLSDNANVEVIKVEKPEDVNHKNNSVYIPRFGSATIVCFPSEMTSKPTNYLQIPLNDAFVSAEYLANYLNSPLGKKGREGRMIGTVINQIRPDDVLKILLFIPNRSDQSKIIQIDSKIEEFSLKLNEIRRNLWKSPKRHSDILKELKQLNNEESLQDWIDKLPFPLSSIIWRYYASKENNKKVEHLLHFFEAFSEFFSMLMLSAFTQDENIYKSEKHKWIGSDEKFKDWYVNATFGSWNILTASLAKLTRSYFNDTEKKDYCQTLFGGPSDEFIKMITSKEIGHVLGEASECRNKWKGHAGIPSEKMHEERLIVLERLLNELRKNIADGFDETKIIAPTSSVYEDGIFTFHARELMGARTPFNETVFKSLIPLDRKKLYMVHGINNKPIELVPFIKYFEENDAVYFYSSFRSKTIRWVSYHFEKESEINQPANDEMIKAFDYLKWD